MIGLKLLQKQNHFQKLSGKIISMIEIISKKDIDQAIIRIAKNINIDYKNKNPILIAVLNGSFIFLSDLVKKIDINLEVDFIKVSSYENTISKEKIDLKFDINSNIKDRDIIIIEDIIDTGLTINFIINHMKKKTPNSISIATLLFKKDRAQLSFDIDYIGFNIPLEFVVGYGMDYNKKLRNLNSIFLLEQKDLIF